MPVAAVNFSRRTAYVLMLLYVGMVALVVFWPNAHIATMSVVVIWWLIRHVPPLAWVSPDAVEFLTNVLLFVPLSFLGHSLRPHWGWGRWLLAGLAATLAIEMTQMVVLSGRSAQWSDIVANTTGAVVGYALLRFVERSPRR